MTEPLTPARRRVLETLLAADGALDAGEVGGRARLHVTTARTHLEALVARGSATRTTESTPGRGRPRVLYAPTRAELDEDSRERLIRVLEDVVARADAATLPEPAGRAWAETLSPPDAADPVPDLVATLDRLGFAPERESAARIALRACPFRDAAERHPDVVCGVHRALVERLLRRTRVDAEVVPFAAPDTCLVRLSGA